MGCGKQTKAKDCHCGQIEGKRGKNQGGIMCLYARREYDWRRLVFFHPCRSERAAYLTCDDLIACLDGALHMWQTSSNFVRPNLSIEGAHTKGTELGSMVFSVDGRTLLTRGGDDTVKCT